MVYVLIALIALGGWLYALVEVLTTDETDVRSLSKFTWFLIVLFAFWIGAVLWALFGRPRREVASTRDRPTRDRRPPAPRGPDDDPDFLRNLDRRLRDDD
ncbi:MAG TPA: PLDc N-terminal domain-containing protein [Streptosporangiaceae bacterium]|jgi:cbb3-type cytochrome oxidase subunit 3|nr:PLDc N-terminal domain-containing protein [Streptosporangiaceae bacterium]